MAKSSLKELKSILQKAMDKQAEYMQVFENDKNPQIVKVYNDCKSIFGAYWDVMHYIETGSKAFFDIDKE